MLKKVMMFLAAMAAAFTFAVPAAFATPSGESFSFSEAIAAASEQQPDGRRKPRSCVGLSCILKGYVPMTLDSNLVPADSLEPDGRRVAGYCTNPKNPRCRPFTLEGSATS